LTLRASQTSILICGAGIAGPALAHWLLRAGFTPTLLERAPALRQGGYVIDFWGKGYDLVEKMGLLPEVLRAGYRMRELRLVDRQGRRASGFDLNMLRATTRFTSLPRSALSAILYGSVASRIETMFGNSITRLDPARDGVHVSFERGPGRRFDLVIGADGLHSTVRRLAFGPEPQFERFLGYTGAFASSAVAASACPDTPTSTPTTSPSTAARDRQPGPPHLDWHLDWPWRGPSSERRYRRFDRVMGPFLSAARPPVCPGRPRSGSVTIGTQASCRRNTSRAPGARPTASSEVTATTRTTCRRSTTHR
jgi:2-polyprenyl-6-methoxyphenol hydroxylase-like FAD-dependent oxidoreductase